MYNLAIRAKNYKCFTDETGFDSLKRVNLVIGRNNSGKSALLDLIEIVTSGYYVFEQSTLRNNTVPQIIFESKIPKTVVKDVFKESSSGGAIPQNHGRHGQHYIGKKVKWTKKGNAINNAIFVECDDEEIQPRIADIAAYAAKLTNLMSVPIQGKIFKRLLAERDILPEKADKNNININRNGGGLTNAIQNFINLSNLSSELVESEILDALNTIFSHDAFFTDIVCQMHDHGEWEIYLEEKIKGRIALSQSGSGLKTVMLVLAYLILIPSLEKKPLNQFVFGFEELENNIHPALLRRLNEYIYRSSIENDFLYFLTTHSNVLIDQFSKQVDAQIIHVKHENSISICTTVNTYLENNGILDDLDIRASDLLQANGVIWVEGPSDRIYLNRWISLWSNGELKEGTHYQIIFYGGRLLSHLDADSPENVQSGISIFNTNRNAIMTIDSDKPTRQKPINSTKQRIKDEFSAMKALCWITKGKEIENYIPSAVVDKFWNLEDSKQVGIYASFFDHLDGLVQGEGKKYSSKKPLLAEKIVPHMTKENLSEVLDLDSRMNRVCEVIRDWNS